jgi:hypothetical protein
MEGTIREMEISLSREFKCYVIFNFTDLLSTARSDSPATRKRGLVSVDYSNQSKARGPEVGTGSLISVNDFNLIRVIGRGSYAKVMLVRYKLL